MHRLTLPTAETYTPEQRRVADIALTSARGRIAGPLPALLVSPTVAEHAHLLGAYLGYKSTVARDVVELAILTTAKQRGSDYAWRVHLPRAHEHGVSEQVTAALDLGEIPVFPTVAQKVGYDITVSLCQNTALSDALYSQGVETFGEQGLVELLALVGFYHIIAMTLNVFGSLNEPHKPA